jgi:Domain of unknown function (DUF4188)
MAREINRGRFTAAHDGDIVVFLIGMRVNKPWKVRQWWPVFIAMPGMLKELAKDPDSGLLGWRGFFGPRTATLLQYWESVEKLQQFAGDPQRGHRPAWLAYFRDSYKDGAVGIWHETYVVPAGSHETIYGNMPALGLGAVKGVVPVAQRGESAADRLARNPI